VYLFDGVMTNALTFAMGLGTYHLLQWTWDGATSRARLDHGAWSTIASGASPAPTGFRVGENYNEAMFFEGRIAEMMIDSGDVIPDATFDNIRAYINARYGLAT
jgi:hypothetical protein